MRKTEIQNRIISEAIERVFHVFDKPSIDVVVWPINEYYDRLRLLCSDSYTIGVIL
jgi:hypothetical protein